MNASVSFPLDAEFLRRECPHCERQFKWHHGPTEDRPTDAVDSNIYFCPYCGESAPSDHWWTKGQIEYIQGIGIGELWRELGDTFRKLEQETRHSMITIKGKIEKSEPPELLHEPPDMVVMQSPCHSWEPIKVDEDWQASLHCLMCGEPFVA